MKNTIKVLSLCLALLASSFTFAESNLSDYPQVRTTINNDSPLIYSYWGCLDEGYTLSDSLVQPVYYIVAPQGVHKQATVTLTLNKKIGGNNSLTTAYITYTVDIMNDGNGNLSVGTISVERMIVH